MLPNFFVIGAARSGTTYMYHLLNEHPEIFMPTLKEPHFFSNNLQKGFEWYKDLFFNHNGETAIGEASVSYTFPGFEKTPQLISEAVPNAKFIYILRNPIKRTFSHYLYYRYYSRGETLPFKEAIKANPVYLGASQYMIWIKRYLNYCDPSNILILFYEDIIRDPLKYVNMIYHFLNVNSSFIPSNLKTKTNSAFKPRSERLYYFYRKISLSKLRASLEKFLPENLRPHLRNFIHKMIGSQNQMPKLTYSETMYLCEYFSPGISDLEKFLNRNLDFWKKPAQ